MARAADQNFRGLNERTRCRGEASSPVFADPDNS
jgi:hypothetical protein